MSDPISAAIEAERARSLAQRVAPRARRSPADVLEEMRERMGAALAYRLGGPEPEEDAYRYVGMTFDSMVSTLLGFRGERWTGASEMFSRGITSSDVPGLLGAAGNRFLRQAYGSYESGLLRLCERVQSRDLRDVQAIMVDGDVALQEVKEAGPFAEGSVKTSAETYPISTFGRIFGLSRTLFTNDDLHAFADLSARLGKMAAEFVAAKLAALLEANPAMSDGVAVFNAAHGNLGSAGALSETTVGELLKLMRAQKGLGGQSIAVVPRALVVPSALELQARKIVAAITPGNAAPPLEVVVEPRLVSAAAHYIVAEPSSVAAISYCHGAGSEGPSIEIARRPGFQGMQAKVSLDLGCGWSDFRGAAKNVGG